MTLTTGFVANEIESMHELLPTHAPIGMLISTHYDPAEYSEPAENGSTTARPSDFFAPICSDADFQSAVTKVKAEGAMGLVVPVGPFFVSRHDRVAALAAQYRMPAVYTPGDLASRGGLLSYGSSFPDLWRQLGVFTAKILKGAKPAELPVEQPSRVVLKVNRTRSAAAFRRDGAHSTTQDSEYSSGCSHDGQLRSSLLLDDPTTEALRECFSIGICSKIDANHSAG